MRMPVRLEGFGVGCWLPLARAVWVGGLGRGPRTPHDHFSITRSFESLLIHPVTLRQDTCVGTPAFSRTCDAFQEEYLKSTIRQCRRVEPADLMSNGRSRVWPPTL